MNSDVLCYNTSLSTDLIAGNFMAHGTYHNPRESAFDVMIIFIITVLLSSMNFQVAKSPGCIAK